MKTNIRHLGSAVGAALALLAQVAPAQTVETSTIGTISQLSPDTIQIRTEAASTPAVYRYTKSTTYVDESGTPVSVETVKSGLPVTVYYTREGDSLVASKVIVRKAVPAPVAPAVEETTTTTTTTTTDQ